MITQKTHIAKPSEIERKWYIIDAKDKVPGRISTKIANLLRGKDKPIFSPHMDCGDFVIVINAGKIAFTAGKENKKKYYKHSGFPGGLKTIVAKDLLVKKPTEILKLAIRGMLPVNKLRDVVIKKLKLYADEKHPHASQQPITLEV
ncbi:MAG: 50S ribosomal protein L13 [Candidatus Gracilibacteria bacterium]|jgi:large subunit ribosomal protein L13